MKIRRIDKKIQAKKREERNEDDAAGMKKKRRLEYPVLDEGWGSTNGMEAVSKGKQTHLSLAGRKISGEEQEMNAKGCPDDRLEQPSMNFSATSTNSLVGEEPGGAAPHCDREPGADQGGGLRQQLITELLSERVRSQPTGMDIKEGQEGDVDLVHVISPDEDAGYAKKMNPEDGGIAVGMCDDVLCDVPASPPAGMTKDYSVNVDIMKDDDARMSMPSSDSCVYKRGVCLFHQMKGVKYTEKTQRWMDRGGGKGYGFVTQRRVRYRCKVENDALMSSSNQKNGDVGDSKTCGEQQFM